jgi:hypothetical protein
MAMLSNLTISAEERSMMQMRYTLIIMITLSIIGVLASSGHSNIDPEFRGSDSAELHRHCLAANTGRWSMDRGNLKILRQPDQELYTLSPPDL